MVQPIDLSKPVYSAVNISIKKPEVNAGKTVSNPMTVNNDNGIYNAVKIDIDSPAVNTEPKSVYDYPEAEGIVTYDMLTINPVSLPQQEKTEAEEVTSEESVEVPAPSYTTLEAEKTDAEEKKTPDSVSKLSFRGNETNVKKPEIVPSEPILPKVDVELVTENLASSDKDVQAQQMEEIVRLAIMEPEKAKNYLVSDIFSELIKITQEDATKLTPPSKEQIEARQKLISNIIEVEKNPKAVDNLPYKMSDEEVAFATMLSPMELTERNKEYAITTLGALSELFIEDYQAKEGKIVPITDAPGVSAIVNALRKDPDSGVKLAAIDALRHINRPEYKEELSAIYTLVKTDPNPNVSKTAERALAELK